MLPLSRESSSMFMEGGRHPGSHKTERLVWIFSKRNKCIGRSRHRCVPFFEPASPKRNGDRHRPLYRLPLLTSAEISGTCLGQDMKSLSRIASHDAYAFGFSLRVTRRVILIRCCVLTNHLALQIVVAVARTNPTPLAGIGHQSRATKYR